MPSPSKPYPVSPRPVVSLSRAELDVELVCSAANAGDRKSRTIIANLFDHADELRRRRRAEEEERRLHPDLFLSRRVENAQTLMDDLCAPDETDGQS